MLGLGAGPEVWVCVAWPGATGPPLWRPSGLLHSHQLLLSWSWRDIKTTIQIPLFHFLDQPHCLISLITGYTRLTPDNHSRDTVNVCSELLHLHGYIYSYALIFDKGGGSHKVDIVLDGMNGKRVMIWWTGLIPSVRMEAGRDAVAVIGIGCNFPGGESTKVRQSRLFPLFSWHFHLFSSLWL